jgi:hypothetical protein
MYSFGGSEEYIVWLNLRFVNTRQPKPEQCFGSCQRPGSNVQVTEPQARVLHALDQFLQRAHRQLLRRISEPVNLIIASPENL